MAQQKINQKKTGKNYLKSFKDSIKRHNSSFVGGQKMDK